MKKSILNLGKALNKVEQKEITGGCPTCGGWSAADCLSLCSTLTSATAAQRCEFQCYEDWNIF